MKAKRRTILTVCLALALMASAILGTIAYMTASSSKTNTFTVGKFDKPTTDPETGEELKDKLNGYIIEKKWVENSKLVPGGEIAKDPRIGIGKDSEDAYVYAFVKNPMVYSGESEEATVIRDGSVYFTLNKDWEFVEADGIDYKELEVSDVKYYTGGLFKYVGGTNGVLSAAKEDAWTGAIFDKVIVGKDVNTAKMAEDNADTKIVVSAFIHQATNGDGETDLAETAETAAKAWAASSNK